MRMRVLSNKLPGHLLRIQRYDNSCGMAASSVLIFIVSFFGIVKQRNDGVCIVLALNTSMMLRITGIRVSMCLRPTEKNEATLELLRPRNLSQVLESMRPLVCTCQIVFQVGEAKQKGNIAFETQIAFSDAGERFTHYYTYLEVEPRLPG